MHVSASRNLIRNVYLLVLTPSDTYDGNKQIPSAKGLRKYYIIQYNYVYMTL